MCSCQYSAAPSSHLLAYQRLASAGLPGLMYGCDSAYLQALQAQAQAPTAPVRGQEVVGKFGANLIAGLGSFRK